MKGATSRKRLRPSPNTKFSFQEHILHSTAIDESNTGRRAALALNTPDLRSPIVINAPSGFPYFSSILQQNGFVVSKPRNHILDQLVFRKNLLDWLQNNTDASKFINSMQCYLRVNENLEHSMTPTLHPDEVFQESLLHNLLNISKLEPEVNNILLSKIMEISCVASSQNEVDRLATMLGQLKWLPNLAGPTNFIKFLISTVEDATNIAKMTLIRFYPDIIPERQHWEVAQTLKNMLENSDSSVVAAILDCFSCLDILPHHWNDLRMATITQLFVAPFQDFPAYLAFLFRTEDTDTLTEVITEMREKLELIPLGEEASKNAVHMVEIVEKIRFCASVNPNLVPIWIGQLKEDLARDDSAVKPLDLMMMLIFGETFKAAIIPLKSICVNQKLTIKLLDNLLKHNMPIINQVHHTLTKLCDTFLRNPKERKVHTTVQDIFVKLFIALSPLETQDMMSNLICFLMNGFPHCRDVVLNILTEITERDAKKLLMFAPHLMGALEVALTFPAHQVRKLLHVLAALAHIEGCADSERFSSEFSILLRKYLTHSNTQSRCFGVIGTLATAHQLSKTPETTDYINSSIRDVVMRAWTIVENEEDPTCVFFDEFSNIVDCILLQMCEEFIEKLTDRFIKTWTNLEYGNIPIHQLQSKHTTLKLSVQLDAYVETEATPQRAVILFEDKPLKMSPRAIPSLVRFLMKLKTKIKLGMEFIIASPILFPDIDLYYKTENLAACTFSQRCSLGIYLILGINFFRECISGFVETEDEDVQIQLWYRIANVVFFQKILMRNFHQFPSLPIAYVTQGKSLGVGEASTSTGPSTSAALKKPQAKASKKEKIKKVVEGETHESRFGGPLQSPLLFPYLRKFDTAVFRLLKNPLNLEEPVDFIRIFEKINNGGISVTEARGEVAKLSPEAMTLLLLEIIQQTKDSENTFSLLDVKDLIQWITLHLKEISEAVNNNSPKIVSTKLDECFQLILTTLSMYCEKVAELDDIEAKERFCQEILKGLTTSQGTPENASEEEKIKVAAEFLKMLSESIGKAAKAVEHLKALSTFCTLFPENEAASSAVVSTAEGYLKSDWKLWPAQVELILKTLILKSSAPMKIMRAITTHFIKPDHGELGSCTVNNFHTWYSVLLSMLSQHVAKHGKRRYGSENCSTLWKEAIVMFKDLVFLTESHRESIILTALLRHSRVFIEAFTNIASTLIPKIQSQPLPEFKQFLKDLQLTTRKLQVVCEHSKVQKDTRLMRNVPRVKRALECLIFRVREVLAVNGMSDAFWLGSLRHRNMDGEEINSQPFNQPENLDEGERSEPEDIGDNDEASDSGDDL